MFTTVAHTYITLICIIFNLHNMQKLSIVTLESINSGFYFDYNFWDEPQNAAGNNHLLFIVHFVCFKVEDKLLSTKCQVLRFYF